MLAAAAAALQGGAQLHPALQQAVVQLLGTAVACSSSRFQERLM